MTLTFDPTSITAFLGYAIIACLVILILINYGPDIWGRIKGL